jgi:hypothetical protein
MKVNTIFPPQFIQPARFPKVYYTSYFSSSRVIKVVFPGPIVQVPLSGAAPFPHGVIVAPPGPIVHVLPGSPDAVGSSRSVTVDALGPTPTPPDPEVL